MNDSHDSYLDGPRTRSRNEVSSGPIPPIDKELIVEEVSHEGQTIAIEPPAEFDGFSEEYLSRGSSDYMASSTIILHFYLSAEMEVDVPETVIVESPQRVDPVCTVGMFLIEISVRK